MKYTVKSKRIRTALPTAGALLAALTLASSAARAQSQCPPPTAIHPWVPADVGTLFMGSALESDGMIQLCSANQGLGPSADGYRLAMRTVEDDFTVTSLVIAVDPGAAGGLIASTAAMPTADGARIAVLAEPVDEDAAHVRLSVSVRMNQGETATWMPSQPVVPLPVRLVMRRQDGVLYVEYEYQGATALLHVQPTAGTGLANNLGAGMIQTSNDGETARSAWFGRPSASLPKLPPAPGCVEDGVLLGDAQPLAIKGRWLDRATEVWVGGAPATILEQSSRRLVVQPPPGPAQPGRQKLVVRTRYASSELPGDIAFVGSPFVRGDVDQDGKVTREDWKQICHAVHRAHPPACIAAGDVNADGAIDEADLDQLKGFLKTGQRPPAGPFPEAGYVAGGFTCGLPQGPSLIAVGDSGGRPIRKALSEGDIIRIRGANLPAAERAVLLFGDVRFDVLGGAKDGTELEARVGNVATPGVRCPTIMDAPADPTQPGATRFGPAYTVNQDSPLCLDFAADLDGRTLSAVADRAGVITLGVPRASFTPGSEILVDAAYLMPFVDGQSAGPRTLQMVFSVPKSPDSRDGYAAALAMLADALAKKLNGHNDDACDCEVDVKVDPLQEKLILAPCVPPPPPPPDPTVPGLPTKVNPIRIIAGHLKLNSGWEQPTCADQHDMFTEPRLHGWCEFGRQVTQLQGGLHAGLPRFETMYPISFISGVFEQPAPYKAPLQRSVAEKGIMISSGMFEFQSFYDGDYNNPCGLALRTTQCVAFQKDWIRPLRAGTHVIKTMWRTKSKLPLHMNDNLLYSYIDPDGRRQYLVGMHIAVSDGFAAHDHYLHWNTFWVPAPNGDTITKDGSPLESEYSPHCTAGHGNDRPAEFNGTIWQNWRMCNDRAAGEGACGNPWILSECPVNGTTSCTGCHETTFGTMNLGGHSLQTGWIAAVRNATVSRANACVADVLANPSDYNDWILPMDGPVPARCGHD